MSIPAPRAPRIPKPPGTHFMVDPVRIRSAWLKVACVAAYLFISVTIGRAMFVLDTPSIVAVFVGNALFVAAVVVGARIFRVREEDPVPARPWWQLTGRPKAGFVIAALLVVADIVVWLDLVFDGRSADVPASILNSAVTVAIAAMYLRSSMLLRRRASA